MQSEDIRMGQDSWDQARVWFQQGGVNCISDWKPLTVKVCQFTNLPEVKRRTDRRESRSPHQVGSSKN